ncbi:MAG: hypothetical protein LBG90_02555 [Spirochaetaceae bacterium]|jgi:hypothetical protein|nr:hypothetical protein [Spirochaetaceae bacterium]
MEKRSYIDAGPSSKDLDRYGVWVKSDGPQTQGTPEEEIEDKDEETYFRVVPLEKKEKTREKTQPEADFSAFSKSETPVVPESDPSMQVLTSILETLLVIKKEITEFKLLFLEKTGDDSAPPYPEKIELAGDELDGIFTEMPPPGTKALAPAALADEKKPPQNGGSPALSQPGEAKAPQGPAPAFSIDDLLIETGSIRDIPLDLIRDNEEETDDIFEEIDFDPEPEKTLEIPFSSDSIEEIPFESEDISSPEKKDSFLTEKDFEFEAGFDLDAIEPIGEEIIGSSSLDLKSVIFADEDIDISDAELDRLERNILLEFADKLPVIEELFGQETPAQTFSATQLGKKKSS